MSAMPSFNDDFAKDFLKNPPKPEQNAQTPAPVAAGAEQVPGSAAAPASPAAPETTAPASAADPAAIKQVVHDTLRSKRAWAALILLLFLLAIGTLVPVGKLPLLRNLAYAMGYSPEETMRLSLFKAVFSWSEHEKIMRGELSDPYAIDVFGSAEAAARAAEQAKGVTLAQDGLFNYNAVNAQRRRRGQQVEQVAGVSGYKEDSDRSDGHHSNIALNNTSATSATDANAAKVSDVFFGQEVGGVSRDKNDGYNSVNSLKKLNFPVAGGTAASGGKDWFLERVDRARRQDAELGGLEDELESHGLASGLGNVDKIGDTKADKDLYWAWLTGRAARRTSQVVLKKTLAAAGFDGADLPKSVFLASGFSGVGINPDDVVTDITTAKTYLELDKECKEAMDALDTEAFNNSITAMRNNLNTISDYIPHTCGDRGGKNVGYKAILNSVQTTCHNINSTYSTMSGRCRALAINAVNVCGEPGFSTQVDDFNAWCDDLAAECQGKTGDDYTTCMNTVNNTSWDASSEVVPRAELEASIKNKYYENGDSEKGLNHDYFPTIDTGKTFKNQMEGREEL